MGMKSHLSLPFCALILCLGCSRDDAKSPKDSAEHLGPVGAVSTGKTDAGAHQRVERGVSEPGKLLPVAGAQTKNNQPVTTSSSSHLEAESIFIEQGGISSVNADEAMSSSESFSKALQEIGREAERSMEAQDQADHYRRVLSRAIGNDGAVADFSCGLSVCMGSVHSRLDVDNEQWTLKFLDDPATRIFGHVGAIEQMGNFNEIRFIFSTDPDLPGIVVPIKD